MTLLLIFNMWLLNTDALRAHVRFLADGLLEGREATSRGQIVAARYISSHFQQFGLEPISPETPFPYEQPFFMYRAGVVPEKTLLKRGSNQALLTENLFSFTGAYPKKGTSERSMVFIGYAYRASKHNFNDYEGVDLTGKVVLALDGYPPHLQGDIKDSARRRASVRERKVGWMQKAGAAGVIFLPGASFQVPDFRPQTEPTALVTPEQLSAKPVEPAGTDFPIIELTEEGVERLFAGDKAAILQNLAERNQTQKSPPLVLEKTLTLISETASLALGTQNVGGIVRGTDPKLREEYVVVSAHFDHLGIRNGEIHYGADDNASGTGLLIELARHLKANPPKRSVLFLAMSAEEKGLVGSRHFLANCPVPREQIICDINVDMVGRNALDEIALIPAANDDVSTLNTWTKEVNATLEKPMKFLEHLDRYHSRSDHYNFVKEGIPALFFFSDDHEDYHRPSDTWDKINFDKMARVGALVSALIEKAGNSPERPQFSKARLPTP